MNNLRAPLCCAFCLGALSIFPALGQTVAAPTISTTPALNGAVIVSLSTTTPGATIWYAIKGPDPERDPSKSSWAEQRYDAPFLADYSQEISARASIWPTVSSATTIKLKIPKIPSGTLVWEDEFLNSTGSIAEPNPNFWTYGTGTTGTANFLGAGVQHYCAWNSSVSPCSPSGPNVFVNPHGGLAIVARNPSSGVYTSGQLTTQGLFSFQYGRVEVRAKVPEALGFWPAIWLLGNGYTTVGWPACGEQDILERHDAAGWPPPTPPDWNQGSIHGNNFTGGNFGTNYWFPTGQTAASWHTYGMIWKPGSVAYYVDDPSNPYVTYTPATLNGIPNASWPFDWYSAPAQNDLSFIIINFALGGWAQPPDPPTTPFPSAMLVDYVRIYKN